MHPLYSLGHSLSSCLLYLRTSCVISLLRNLCSPMPPSPSIAGDGDVRDKTAALKRIIQLMLNGERFPSLLMPVIQYVMPQRDHTLKKLLLIFWEIVPKTTPDGKLLHEMILVCDAYRKVSGRC